jgi:hypothetical protein
MSISQNFPDEGPSLNLNFASSRILDPRITFTRTSTGTYTDKNGLVTIAPTDTPRFDHSYNGSNVESLGLLIEESRTNLVLRSQEFETSWGSAAATIGVNSTTSPDGTVTADKLQEDNTNNQHLVVQSIGTLSIGAVYTFSCWAKAAERTQVSLTAHAEGYSVFDLSSGTIIQTGGNSNVTITPYPNGWYRCSTTITKTNTNGAFYIIVWNNTNVYTGTTGSGIHIWGAQLETGAFPTSYIPTVASTVTRSADNASMTGTNFSSWYNSSEGSVITNIKYDGAPVSGATSRTGYVLYNATNGNMRQIWWEGTNTGAFLGENPAGSYVIVTNVAQTITQGSTNKIATAYKLNDFPITQNGGTIATDTSGTPPVTTSLFIGSLIGIAEWVNGRIAQLSYYPKRLTNSQLQNLTK